MAHRTHTSKHFWRSPSFPRIALIYIVGGVLWLVISTAVWGIARHPRYVGILKTLYFVGSIFLLYAFMRRERTYYESREEYSLLVENMLEPVLIHQDGIVVSANTSALQFFEAETSNELLGIPIMNVVDNNYQQIVTDRIETLYRGKSTKLQEEQLVTLRGNTRDIEIAGVSITFHRKPAVLVIFRDITARKQAAAAIEDRERRLRTLIDALPDHICFIDNEGRWIEANNSLLHAVGLQNQSFRSKTAEQLAGLCAPIYRKEFLDNSLYTEATYKHGNHFTYEYMLPDGTPAASDISRVPVQAADGTNMGLVVISRDVTDQRLAVRRLAESEQRYRSLFENDSDMVVSLDRTGVIVSANPAAQAILGYTVNELIGLKPRDLLLPEYQPEAYARYVGVLEGNPQTALIQLRRKDGRIIDVEEKQIPIRENNKVSGFFCIARDITAQKQTEELIIRSERLSAVGQMAAGVAHEIRNPLAVLKGFVQLMQTSPEKTDFYLEIMKSEFDRIESIVNEMLVFAKPTKRDLELCDGAQLVKEVVTLMTPEANLRNITMSQSIASGRYNLHCEKNQIKQVLVNIVKNAIEAMTTGGDIAICIAATTENKVSIVVRDNGPGIPEQRMAHIGEPFYTTKETGTGLGLTVSRKIIEAHKGLLHIHSQVGLGTEVEVVLPKTI
ncbi:PAS domain-containing protein [Alicyclobacillus sp. ALC3]|uniref:PAS domain-containing protein n=1 Tax=Alicyclobacillus sp. ALC3 TaxID=2796143 RepID=UPI002377E036|nr:PAS domain-containing sensor histidine kinase [Alicyclobacillus sp. ALC3]WDL97569.1 PAS domain S-box protein [Alicyclobacillus sp. ALC3]